MSRRRSTTLQFNAIQLVGGLLPASLIEQIALQQAPQQKPIDYGLQKNQRLQVSVDQAWNRAKALWQEAQELGRRGDEMPWVPWFSERLLKQVFDWTDLGPCPPRPIAEALFPITHQAFSGAVPLVVTSVNNKELDQGHKQFGQDGRRRSPHSCLQECLNADDGSNWGLLCNGTSLRLLHDNPALVKPAYVAVALDQIFDGGLFDEFALLWLLLHASRFQRGDGGSCVLDSWKQEGQKSGERALDDLRDGVEAALVALGQGLLRHKANGELVAKLVSGELSTQDFLQQLLRLVYRLLFLCVAEDRGLLFAAEVPLELRQIYREGYSLSRLRDLAIKSGAHEHQHGDLWLVQKLVFVELSQAGSQLGLPGLGGLFRKDQCPDLDKAELSNAALLEAIRAIGWFYDEQSQSRTRINYQALNTEEFGSVYESLLELHPQISGSSGALRFSLGGVAGSERKTSGSYYTPEALVQLLIDSALMPAIEERLQQGGTAQEKKTALLTIRILDPACGSGHFLLAAARKLALELARLLAGDDEPSEDLRRHCMRELVAKCIYGVDKNPMAVELCKVALWIEAMEPGKPLSFLDAHVQCGDSLVGVFDPEVLKVGIPDGAYKPLTGDEKPTCNLLKKANQEFNKRGQRDLFSFAAGTAAIPNQGAFEAVDEDDLAGVEAKQKAYQDWLQHPAVQQELLAANIYAAAFFLPKTTTTQLAVPTSEHLDAARRGGSIPGAMAAAVDKAEKDFRFLHWHLAFPEAMKAGGFDCVIGNPPWEVLEEEEKKFFSGKYQQIADATGARRKSLVASLKSANPILFSEWQCFSRERESFKEFHRIHPALELSSYKKLNLYASFLELTSALVRREGSAGLVIQGGLLSDESRSKLAAGLMKRGRISSYYEFNNTNAIFRDIHRQQSFAVITLVGKGVKVDAFALAFGCEAFSDIIDPTKAIRLNPGDTELMSPIDGTVPKARSANELSLIAHIYRRVPPFCIAHKSESMGPSTIFNITTANEGMELLRPDESSGDCKEVLVNRYANGWMPLMEGKYVTNYSCRNSTFRGCSRDEMLKGSASRIPCEADGSGAEPVMPRWWMSTDRAKARLHQLGIAGSWMLGFCDVTNSENQRTALCSFLPATAASHTLWIFTGDIPFERASMLCACINSLVFDFVAKRRVSSRHLTKSIFLQLPIPPASFGEWTCPWEDVSLERWIASRVGTIYRNTVEELCLPVDFSGLTNDITPEVARAEIDACLLAIFLANREGSYDRPELDDAALSEAKMVHIPLILSVFGSLKDAERSRYGEYRTERLVLEAWDRLFGS